MRRTGFCDIVVEKRPLHLAPPRSMPSNAAATCRTPVPSHDGPFTDARRLLYRSTTSVRECGTNIPLFKTKHRSPATHLRKTCPASVLHLWRTLSPNRPPTPMPVPPPARRAAPRNPIRKYVALPSRPDFRCSVSRLWRSLSPNRPPTPVPVPLAAAAPRRAAQIGKYVALPSRPDFCYTMLLKLVSQRRHRRYRHPLLTPPSPSKPTTPRSHTPRCRRSPRSPRIPLRFPSLSSLPSSHHTPSNLPHHAHLLLHLISCHRRRPHRLNRRPRLRH